MRRIEASGMANDSEVAPAPRAPRAYRLLPGDHGKVQVMRILVTGGAGFIGSHYVRTMLTGRYPGYEHAQVTVLDKLTYAGNLANLEPIAASPRFSFVRGDICDEHLLASIVPGHDLVVNFAAETHVDRSIVGAASFVSANVAGVQALLQACVDARVPRVVQVSTDEVYGSVASGSWTEDANLEPNSPYAAAKAGGDLMARAFARTHGLDVSITRCCNNYGPYQFPEKVIPLFVTNLLDGLKVPLYGDGQNVRGWVHVDDHCQGIQLVVEKGHPGHVYHINGDTELSNVELTKALLECFGAGWEMVTPVPDRKGHDRRYSLDDSVLRAMGYAPRIPFSAGLPATVRWYRDNRRWWEPLKQAHADSAMGALSEPAYPADPGRRRRSTRRKRLAL
jgi:dTDP-glucose 4,6-dehydratase